MPASSAGTPVPRKGNILLVANWPSEVGYAWWLMENFWSEIAHRYAPVGSDVYLMYPEVESIPASIAAAPIEVLEHRFDASGPRATLRLVEFVRSKRITNVYLTDSVAVRPLYAALRLAGVRRIVIHDHTPGDRPPTRGTRRLLKRLRNGIPWTRADYFVGVTDFVRRRMIDNASLPPSRCGVAPNGIIPIDPGEGETDVRVEFGLPSEALVVVTTGRAHYYKGIDFVVELASRIVNDEGRDDVHFVFCGDGPDLEAFKALAAQRDLGDHFVFAGRRADVRALLSSCDVGLQASLGEVGYSLSILEYMSAGLPTLVPDLPSTSGATEVGVTGLVFPSGDLEVAAERLKELLDDAELRRRLGSAGRRAVVERYRLQDTNRSLLSILDRVFR